MAVIYVIIPVVGELGEAAYNFLFILPARNASLPASIDFLMALAIKIGFFAVAIAVFINTPSQPNSIAIEASEAVHTQASTITGTDKVSIIISKFQGFNMPIPEPMSDAKGITAQQPISSSCLAMIGSSDV